eukprot:CAMPEP_0169428816 /NCGR_PEP_ID=MMETSP1042-20121227/1530_1 /TAXON_ID=464988 /ORGANISM="Hemiselmis andersenii, Strain CCMP1180" /LENGTH=147 /DNA_ID=CAMNT_0009539015 /DNA_START=1 /DNA_END=441 /DNA_ORIENTATION=-
MHTRQREAAMWRNVELDAFVRNIPEGEVLENLRGALSSLQEELASAQATAALSLKTLTREEAEVREMQFATETRKRELDQRAERVKQDLRDAVKKKDSRAPWLHEAKEELTRCRRSLFGRKEELKKAMGRCEAVRVDVGRMKGRVSK